ncbi:hypothetical protein HanOQP8_Chr10g0367201 [Helianthus annuus]|nr:hypothetical protein HanOQP8_Chr10g0367201 [Helianthus annuus]
MLSLETDPDGTRVSAFECGLKTSLAGRHHLVDLRAFDMVFVTMLEGDHYYIVVYDLEAECIHLVDHLGDRGSGALLRDDESYIMKSTPFKVLVNHPKATTMQASLIMREDLPWSTTRRIAAPFVESGIFAMRHMEQLVGSRRNFFCGFSVHGEEKGPVQLLTEKVHCGDTPVPREQIWRRDTTSVGICVVNVLTC